MAEYKLWENSTPYFDENFCQPETTIVPYLVNGQKNKPSVVIFPGGGYSGRAFHEGEPIAQMLNKSGISAFVVNYRVKPYKYPSQLADAQRAVRFVRFNAEEFEVSPEKISVLGFSAGGHLAVMAMEKFDTKLEKCDEIDEVSARPDGAILCYPVVSLLTREYNGRKPFAHFGTSHNLLGEDASVEMQKSLSGELNVPENCPPVFIWHTFNDGGVPVYNSLYLAEALREKNIKTELHLFPDGPHGLGLADGNGCENIPHVAQWAGLLVNWIFETFK